MLLAHLAGETIEEGGGGPVYKTGVHYYAFHYHKNKIKILCVFTTNSCV